MCKILSFNLSLPIYSGFDFVGKPRLCVGCVWVVCGWCVGGVCGLCVVCGVWCVQVVCGGCVCGWCVCVLCVSVIVCDICLHHHVKGQSRCLGSCWECFVLVIVCAWLTCLECISPCLI